MVAIMASCMALPASAQTSDVTVSVYAAPSHMINAIHIYDWLITSYNYCGAGAQVGFVTRPEDCNWYEKALNYPEFGVGVSWQPYSHLTCYGTCKLGDMYNLYGYGTWDFLKWRRFSFGPTAQLGLSYTGVTYDKETNPNNVYISNNLEFLVSMGLNASLRLCNHFSLEVSAMGIHHSNVKQGTPNLGLNEVSVYAGAKYWFGSPVDRRKESAPVEKPVIEDRLTISPYIATGVHSCERIAKAKGEVAGPVYWRYMTGVDVDWRYHPLFSSGVSLDAVYTTNIADLKACDQEKYPDEYPSMSYSPFYFGVAALQRFHYRRFDAHVKLGYYLFKKVGITEDWGRTYQKVGVTYTFANNLYVGADMLVVRFDTSDCLEFTLGYRIPVHVGR